jgi:small subunit ribosomal protein S8
MRVQKKCAAKKEHCMDPIANLLCCIRNGQQANKTYVSVPYSKLTWIIAHVLFKHGYIAGMGVRHHIPLFVGHVHVGARKKPYAARICLVLVSPVMHGHMNKSLVRVSSPKKRVYLPAHHLRNSMSGYGFRILSTTKGIMTDLDAIPQNLGGEVLCACV